MLKTLENRRSPRGTFAEGLSLFFLAALFIFVNPRLRPWYRRTILRTVLVALGLWLLSLGGGSYLLWKFITPAWGAKLAVLVYVLLLTIYSGLFTALLSWNLVGPLSSERALLSALSPEKLAALLPARRADRWEEWRALLTGAVASLLVLPLFIFPWALPLAILLLAWPLGKASLAAARRLCHQNEESTRFDESRAQPSLGLALGLAMLPAVGNLFPLLGWLLIPVLQLAGLLAVRAQAPTWSQARRIP